MIVILSPAKTLSTVEKEPLLEYSTPVFANESWKLNTILKRKTVNELRDLMHISEKLAVENHHRYNSFSKDYTLENSDPSILCFQGDVYKGLVAEDFNLDELKFANTHIRILSGLYGILKPLDRMQPYRLEMGTKLENPGGETLYNFWGDKITKFLKKEINSFGHKTLVNLASNEYSKVLDLKSLKIPVINIDFKEEKDGNLRFISFNAKRARGLMTRYIIKNGITDPEHLKGFDYDEYYFSAEHSGKNTWTFIR
jgi:uncharacterized protein